MAEPYAMEEVKVVKETERAFLVEYEEEEFWVPKSVVDEESEVEGEGDEGVLLVAAWWAKQKGLGE